MKNVNTYLLLFLIAQCSIIIVALWFIIKTLRPQIFYGIRKWWVYLIVDIRIILGRRIIVKVLPEYISIYQNTNDYYLLEIHTCSRERFFKVMSGDFTTIIPEKYIYEIDGNDPNKFSI